MDDKFNPMSPFESIPRGYAKHGSKRDSSNHVALKKADLEADDLEIDDSESDDSETDESESDDSAEDEKDDEKDEDDEEVGDEGLLYGDNGLLYVALRSRSYGYYLSIDKSGNVNGIKERFYFQVRSRSKKTFSFKTDDDMWLCFNYNNKDKTITLKGKYRPVPQPGKVMQAIEKVPVVGYGAAAVHLAKGDNDLAKKSAAKCTNSIVVTGAVIGELQLQWEQVVQQQEE